MIIQAIITAALTLGIFYVKKRKITPHGYVTLAAVVLNTLSVIIVMLPSALRIVSGASMNVFTMVVIAHSILGAAAIIVGIYLIVVWRLRNYIRPSAIIWILSAALGAYVYYLLL